MAGRPKGRPKTGGRAKGTANKISVATRERIEKEADPIGFLIYVVQGRLMKSAPMKDYSETVDVYPTLDQRISAAQALARKIVPDMKAVEHSGKAAVPVTFVMNIPDQK